MDISDLSLKPTLDLLLERDGWRCSICHDSIECRSDASLDHILPRYHKGPDTFWNLRVAHRTCNVQKGRRIPRPRDIRWTLIQPTEIEEARHLLQRALGWIRWPETAWPPGTREFLAGGPLPTP